MFRFALFPVFAVGLATLGGCAGAGGAVPWMAPPEPRSPMYTAVSSSAAASRAILEAAPVCCDTLAELRFEPLDTQSSRFYAIDARSQAFRFSTGKSLVHGLAIPDDLERATIDLDAIAGATVFVPTVLILDRDFRVSRAIDSSRFKYSPAGFMEPQRLQGRIHLDRRPGSALKNEKYLVVFTTDRDLRGSTAMIGEARLYARSRGQADPRLPNPVAQHAATGVFRVRTADLETMAVTAKSAARQQKRAGRYVTPVATAAAPVKPAAPAPSAPSVAEPMALQTQAIYARMIRESVASGDMDRAWRLVLEAERAGSDSARQTFVDAVKQK